MIFRLVPTLLVILIVLCLLITKYGGLLDFMAILSLLLGFFLGNFCLDCIIFLNCNCMLPWLVGGDFNEIPYESEKVGGSLHSLSQMREFSEVINDCMLSDMNVKGDQFTWCNRRLNYEIIFLDRFLCNSDWHLMFPSAEVSHLDFFGSDHRLITVSMKIGCDVSFRKGPKRILFEHKWMMEEDFNRVMDQWKDNGNIVELPSKLSHFSDSLRVWPGYLF